MKIYLSFTIAASKMFFRRKSSIFWSLFFPVVTMLVLGNAGFIGYSAPNVGLFFTTENETIDIMLNDPYIWTKRIERINDYSPWEK